MMTSSDQKELRRAKKIKDAQLIDFSKVGVLVKVRS